MKYPLRERSFGDDSLGAYVATGVIAFAFADLHATNACMDEGKLAGVIVSFHDNADMAYILAAAAACEEDQIALAEALAVDLLALGILHSGCGTQIESELAINIAGETGAIESGRPFGTMTVWLADMLARLLEQIVDHAVAFGAKTVQSGMLAVGDIFFKDFFDGAFIHLALLDIRKLRFVDGIVCAACAGIGSGYSCGNTCHKHNTRYYLV